MGNLLDAHKTKTKKKVVVFETDEALVARLDAAARAAKVSRSWVIREICSGWLAAHDGGAGP
jgi:predicted transcriptional regulator